MSKKDPAQLQQFYYDMLLIRRFEERSGQLYGQGHIGGFCHLYIGQEAIVVGMQSLLNKQDTVITAYRDHGHMLACHMDPNRVMAELTGRRDGYSAGKGGSMHMFSREKNFFGGHGIVGAQVSLGTGMAFAHHYRQDGGVTLVYLGDGAINQGQVYESFNMASLWKLPALYILENNRYAMGTSTKRHASNPDELYRRGEPFGIPGKRVDGMNIFEVIEAGREALDFIRAGKGPYLLEMDSYRYRGHSMSDPGKYRDKEEVESIRGQRDPIEFLRSYMLEHKLVTEEALKELDQKVKEVVQESARFALESPEPDPRELYTDILIEGDHPWQN